MAARSDGVLVTGGASGIGLAIVRHLLREGYTVGVLDLHPVPESALEDVPADRLATFEVDIADHGAVAEAVRRFAGDTGGVYGLVNNAGWDKAQPFVQTDPGFWRKVIDINLFGPLNVTYAVLPHMVDAGRGRVVSIASDAGRVGSSGEAVYSAAKGGTIALMKTLAREHARDGITFNTICPGPTDTPLLKSFDESGRLALALERAVPMGRLARPDDFPALVGYFLSEDAGYVTGQTISVSGGLTMHG